MDGRGIWRRGRALLLVTATAVAFGTIGATFSASGVPVAQAGVAQDDKDKDNKKSDRDKAKTEKEQEADRVAEGQVLLIDTLKNPPELLLGTGDGEMVVKMFKTDEIALHGVKLGDYVKVDGEKVHELLFEAQMLEVTDRYSDPSADNDNKSDKKKKKN